MEAITLNEHPRRRVQMLAPTTGTSRKRGATSPTLSCSTSSVDADDAVTALDAGLARGKPPAAFAGGLKRILRRPGIGL